MELEEDFSRALDFDDRLDDRHGWLGRPRCSGCAGSFAARYLRDHEGVCILFQRKEQEYQELREKLLHHAPRPRARRGPSPKFGETGERRLSCGNPTARGPSL